jgi:hypothetical protein
VIKLVNNIVIRRMIQQQSGAEGKNLAWAGKKRRVQGENGRAETLLKNGKKR